LIRVAVAGAGQWGRNHIRVLAGLPGVDLAWVVDSDASPRALVESIAPRARFTTDPDEALGDPRVRALVVASPTPSHGPLAKAALARGKHCLVEKPLASGPAEAWDLVRTARRAGRILAVGHLLLYHPTVKALKRLIDRRALGRLHYLYGQRTNLGRIRTDEGAMTSLAPHDISVMVHLLGRWPTSVSAHGAAFVQPRWEDVVFLTLRFPGGVLGHVHLSWLDPEKVRRLSLVGDRRMAVFDDMEPVEKLRLHDKAAITEPLRRAGNGPLPGALEVRSGRTRAVPVPLREPLAEELKSFLRSVRRGTPPETPGEDGARVAEILAAAERSLRAGGETVTVRVR
jgi:predicted dehydrogenase